MILYSSGCPKCKMIKSILDRKKIEYELVDDESIYIPVAEANKIKTMPFAELNGDILNCEDLQKYLLRNKGGMECI